jgi:hypothetical protein
MAEYRIHLRSEPSGVPEIIRLRRALKVLLRSFGLRAIDVRTIPDEPIPAKIPAAKVPALGMSTPQPSTIAQRASGGPETEINQ